MTGRRLRWGWAGLPGPCESLDRRFAYDRGDTKRPAPSGTQMLAGAPALTSASCSVAPRPLPTILGVDSSTPAGRMAPGVPAQPIKFERATLVKRTNADLLTIRRRGKHLGRPHSLTSCWQREARRMQGEESMA